MYSLFCSCVASGAKWFISNLYGRVPRAPFNFEKSLEAKKSEAQEGVEATVTKLLRPEGGILTTSTGE